MGFGVVRDKEEIAEVAAEARRDIGPEHFDGNRFALAVARDLATMHLRDRGRGHRWPQARKCLRHRAIQRRCYDSLGFGLRERRQAVLQAFQIACHIDADHVGPGGEKLPEFEIGRPKPRQCARQPRAGFGAGPLDDACKTQRQLAGRRHQRGIDDAEYALAREHKAGAGQPRDVRGR